MALRRMKTRCQKVHSDFRGNIQTCMNAGCASVEINGEIVHLCNVHLKAQEKGEEFKIFRGYNKETGEFETFPNR